MDLVGMRVLQLHGARGVPTQIGATWVSRIRAAAALRLGLFFAKHGVPGVIRDVSIVDDYSGHTLAVRTGPFFVRVSIDGRDFFFDRYTGKFDGTGSGCT